MGCVVERTVEVRDPHGGVVARWRAEHYSKEPRVFSESARVTSTRTRQTGAGEKESGLLKSQQPEKVGDSPPKDHLRADRGSSREKEGKQNKAIEGWGREFSVEETKFRPAQSVLLRSLKLVE